MKREEEIRQEMSKIAGTHPDWSKNDCMRVGFYEGAKWADKIIIDKACKWLININTDDYMDSGIFQMSDLIIDFKKAMEL